MSFRRYRDLLFQYKNIPHFYLHVRACWPPGIAAEDSGLWTKTKVEVVVDRTDPTGWTSVNRQHSCPCKSADASWLLPSWAILGQYLTMPMSKYEYYYVSQSALYKIDLLFCSFGLQYLRLTFRRNSNTRRSLVFIYCKYVDKFCIVGQIWRRECQLSTIRTDTSKRWSSTRR